MTKTGYQKLFTILCLCLIIPGCSFHGKKALLIVDVQEEWIKHYSTTGSNTFINDVNKVIGKAAEENIIPVYILNEGGGDIDKRINVASTYIFTKKESDAFTNSELGSFLKKNNVKDVFVIGLDAAFCVYTTSQGAKDEGYRVAVVEDAIISRLEGDNYTRNLKNIQNYGIDLITSEEF